MSVSFWRSCTLEHADTLNTQRHVRFDAAEDDVFLGVVPPWHCLESGVRLLELGEEEIKAAGVIGMDPLRLTLLFDKGLGGFEADDMLTEGEVLVSQQSCSDARVWICVYL